MKSGFESSQILDDFREDLTDKVEHLEIAETGVDWHRNSNTCAATALVTVVNLPNT